MWQVLASHSKVVTSFQLRATCDSMKVRLGLVDDIGAASRGLQLEVIGIPNHVDSIFKGLDGCVAFHLDALVLAPNTYTRVLAFDPTLRIPVLSAASLDRLLVQYGARLNVLRLGFVVRERLLLDRIIGHCTALRELHICGPLASQDTLRRLPSTLRSLSLRICSDITVQALDDAMTSYPNLTFLQRLEAKQMGWSADGCIRLRVSSPSYFSGLAYLGKC